MNPVPYTLDAVKAIRQRASAGAPPDIVMAELGWDVSMLDNVCRRHAIAFKLPARLSPPLVLSKIAAQYAGKLLDIFIATLPPRQRLIMFRLLPTIDGEDYINSTTMAFGKEVISYAIHSIRRKLARDRIPFRIESKPGRSDSGYRLARSRA